jgi:hypothetical protein
MKKVLGGGIKPDPHAIAENLKIAVAATGAACGQRACVQWAAVMSVEWGWDLRAYCQSKRGQP